MAVNQQQHNSHSQSPLHFNSVQINSANNNNNTNNNNNNSLYVQQQQQQINYMASSPKHNHHQNLASPVNYLGTGGYGTSANNNVASNNSAVNASSGTGSAGGLCSSDSGSNSNLTYPQNFVNFLSNANTLTSSASNASLPLMTIKSTKSVQVRSLSFCLKIWSIFWCKLINLELLNLKKM